MTYKFIIKRLSSLSNQKGQGMVEYVLIIAFIALAVIASLTPFGKLLADKFTQFAAIFGSS